MAGPIDVQHAKTLFDAMARERAAFLKGIRPDTNAWFKMIDGPPNMGSYQTGDDGWAALWALTESAMVDGKIAARADPSEVHRILARVFVRKFISEGLTVDQRNVTRALNEVIKAAKRDFQSLTHFIPCQLTTKTEPVGISLGALRFLGRAEAKIALREMLRAEHRTNPDRTKQDRELLLRAIARHKGYRWFAQVPVTSCASKRSAEIAMLAATSALDFLQLILGARRSQRMRIDARPEHYEITASIQRDELSGRYSFSTGWEILGEGLPDGWTTDLLAGQEGHALQQAGVILESRLDPDLNRPLSQRMLDVAQWFGEAVRDRSPSTRLVKYVTALERLTLTRRERTDRQPDRIADLVSDRIAALATGLFVDRTFAENKTAFKKLYSIRSQLVHGSISPLHAGVAGAVRDANDYCEFTINRALHMWHDSALRDPNLPVERLEDWFNALVEWRQSGEVVDLSDGLPAQHGI